MHHDEMQTHELKTGGQDIFVTNENRSEYVARYVKYVLEDSVANQIIPFVEGFLMVSLYQGDLHSVFSK